MNILNSIVISMIASHILVGINLVIDSIIKEPSIQKVKEFSIQKVCGYIIRSIILGVFLTPLLFWTSQETPRLSIIQKNISVSYHKKDGLKIEGIFSGGKNKHIYLLVRQNSDSDNNVWTVTKEVVSIQLPRFTWDTRLYLQGINRSVNSGDTYSIIGIMTDETLTITQQIPSASLIGIKGAFTEELEIKIKEVLND